MRSLFTDRAREHYRDANLVLPDVKEFIEVPGFFRVGKMDYNAPPDEVIVKTFAELENLRGADRNAYVAICLACGAGLRKGEVAQARRSWFSIKDGVARLQAKIQTKNGQFIDLPLLPEWWARLEVVLKDAWSVGDGEDAYLLEGNRQEREEEVFRRIGPWMRELGWETQKTFHEFRAYVGSMIAMDSRYGMEIASMFLRHHSVDFTRRYYLRYVKLKQIQLKSFGAAAA
jgi:integrase